MLKQLVLQNKEKLENYQESVEPLHYMVAVAVCRHLSGRLRYHCSAQNGCYQQRSSSPRCSLHCKDLADAVEDTRRGTGVQPVPKLKVSSANPDSTKFISLIMKAMPKNDRRNSGGTLRQMFNLIDMFPSGQFWSCDLGSQ